MSLAFEDEGFSFGGVMRDVATGEVVWAVGLSVVASRPDVATDGDPFGFNGE